MKNNVHTQQPSEQCAHRQRTGLGAYVRACIHLCIATPVCVISSSGIVKLVPWCACASAWCACASAWRACASAWCSKVIRPGRGRMLIFVCFKGICLFPCSCMVCVYLQIPSPSSTRVSKKKSARVLASSVSCACRSPARLALPTLRGHSSLWVRGPLPCWLPWPGLPSSKRCVHVCAFVCMPWLCVARHAADETTGQNRLV